MGGDDRNHAARPEDEAFSTRLLQGVSSLHPQLSLVFVDQRVLSHAAAYYAIESFLSFRQGWKGLAIMPVHDLKIERIEK